MLRIPHGLDNRLTEGDEVVSLTQRYSFLLETEQNPGHSAAGKKIGKLKKIQ
jgi:hypothetical protein